MENQILGEWKNSKKIYAFYKKNSSLIIDARMSGGGIFLDGFYKLDGNIITLNNGLFEWECEIISITKSILAIKDLSSKNEKLEILFNSSDENLDLYIQLHKWVIDFLKTNDKQPTFKDYWKYIVEENQGYIYVWDEEMFEQRSLLWETSSLGNSNWKEIWNEYYKEKTFFERNESKFKHLFSISLFTGIPFIILSSIRHSYYYNHSMFDGAINFLTFISVLISTIITFYLSSIFFSYLQKKPIFDVEHYYTESFSIFFNSKLWKKNIVGYSMMVSFILATPIAIFYKNHFFWLYLLILILVIGLLTFLIKRGRVFLSLVIVGITPIISILTFLRFEIYGIYYHWFLTKNDGLINYGFEDKGDPLDNKECFLNIKEWGNYGNPVPNSENQLEYFTSNILDNFIFYSFNGVFLFGILTCFYMLGNFLFNNLKKNNYS